MPEPIRHTLVHYIDEAGHDLFGDWLETFSDKSAQSTGIKTARKRLANWNQRGTL